MDTKILLDKRWKSLLFATKNLFLKMEKKILFVKTEKEIIFTKLEASPNKCWRERNIKNLEEKSNFFGYQKKLGCFIII